MTCVRFGALYGPRIFEHLRVIKLIVSFVLLGLGKALPNKFLTETEEVNAEIRATGRYLLLVSDHYPALRFFMFLPPNLTDS